MTTPAPAALRALVRRFADATVAVVGDVMIDQFVFGRVDRISPEAPVPVVSHDRDEYRVGGAANVAHNVRALGGRVALLGVVGADEAGARLAAELGALAIDTAGLVTDPRRRTTRKLRIVTTRNQQIGRIDYEDDGDLEAAVEAALRSRVDQAAATAQVVVVSDYLKGTVTRGLVAHALAIGRARGIPVLVDPKIPHLDYYAGASLVTPNHHEAEIATRRRIRTDEAAAAAARAFRELARCDSVLVTRGEHGMDLVDGSTATGEPPCQTHLAAAAREVADVTGAGDTVIATIALALAAGGALVDAARLANHAAGLVVAKFGPATVSADELLAALG